MRKITHLQTELASQHLQIALASELESDLQDIVDWGKKRLVDFNKKSKNFMAPFYGRGSTASRLQPLRGGSLLSTIQFPELSGTHFIDLGRMKG